MAASRRQIRTSCFQEGIQLFEWVLFNKLQPLKTVWAHIAHRVHRIHQACWYFVVSQRCVNAGERSACTHYHSALRKNNSLACLYFFKQITIVLGGAGSGCSKIESGGTCFGETLAGAEVRPCH